MKPFAKILIVGATMLALLIINTTVAKAAVTDCASQEGCIALLQDTQVKVFRKGVLKGVITGTNSEGTISSTNGWILTTDTGNSDVYLYEVATGTMCMAQTPGGACEEGVVFIYPSDPIRNRAYLACPWTNEMASIALDCSSVWMISTGGSEPRSITQYMDDKLLTLNRNSTETPATLFGYYGTNGMNWSVYLGELFQPSKVRYWDNSVDPAKVFISDDDILYWQSTNEIPPGLPPVFYNLPAGSGAGSLAVNDEYVLAAPLNGVGVFLIEIANPTSHITLDVTNPFDPVKGPSFVALSDDTAFAVDAGGGVRAFAFDGTLLYTINEPTVYSIAYIAPTLPPVCSNNLVEPGEICDGTDFDGDTCQKHNFDGGALSCSASCDTVFVSGCWSCGDGTLNPGETCDGSDLGGASCTAAGYEAGDVTCTDTCTADYSACYTCGNNLIEGAENCEGADLNGATCESIGFVAGTLSCDTGCMFDTSACHMCGNSIADAGETCDGTDVPGQICQTLPGLGYTGGTLGCNATCNEVDDSACYTCGDGTINLTEECDGANLAEQTCESLGLGTGTLACFENCTWNYTQCSGVTAEYCGNGVTDPGTGEECDDGNRSNSDDCSEFCKIIPPTCGIEGIDAGETCDGTDLGGATCQSLGYEAGVLYCGADCQLRTNDCRFVSTPQNISLTLDAEPEPGELETLAQQYTTLKSTLTPNCVPQNVNGDLVMTTTPGSYCSMRARVLDSGDKMFSFIYIPENPLENENPVVRFYQNGDIAQNFGGQITAFEGLQVKTVLLQNGGLYQVTQNRISSMGMQFLGVHPDTQLPGRWLALNIGVGSTDLCIDEAGEVCAKIVPQQGQVIINLDALEDISDIGWKPPKDGGGCSCSAGNNNSNSSLPVIFLMVAALLFVKRRRSLKK